MQRQLAMAEIDKNSSPKRSYMDALPEEVLWNIVRHLSPCPRLPNWALFISSKDLAALCEDFGKHNDVFRERLMNICVAESRRFEDLFTDRAPEEECFVNLQDLTKFLSMESLSLLGLRMCFDFELTSAALEPLIRHGIGLKSISLEVPSGTRIESILDLWPAVGESLENLIFDGSEDLKHGMLEGLQKHCRKLRNIHICALRREPDIGEPYWTALTELYVSYGTQLESISIDYLPAECVKEIQVACPNIRVRLLSFRPDELPTMRTLGPCVSFLYFSPSSRKLAQSKAKELEETTASFTSLQAAEICRASRKIDDKFFSALSALPKNNLEVLHLKYLSYGQTENLLCMASTGARRLRTITCEILPSELSAIRKVIRRNCELEIVNIEIDASKADIEKDLTKTYTTYTADLVKEVFQCSKLRELIIDICPWTEEYSEDIEKLCIGFRSRRTYVKIMEIVYHS